MTRLVRSFAHLLPIVLLLPACSGGGPKLYPVRGQMFFLDQPAAGATVVFHPLAGGADAPLPSGTVGADGSFTLSTHPHGPGAPAGTYVVCVTWFPTSAREQEGLTNRLPDRFATPNVSPLRATVKDGPNELEPFRLAR